VSRDGRPALQAADKALHDGPALQAAKEEDLGQEYRNAPFEIVEFHC
jgi:hypothetical protein